jgi:23S rRNA (uracil1939-C5)-methyltransferase
VPRPGDLLSLLIEKAAAGGRMLARLEGQIVLVSGTIPGERVRARVEAVRSGVVFARTESIEAASADRRPSAVNGGCGGNDYAHVTYPRQLDLKREIVQDAFARIAHLELPGTFEVHGSPERGYRMRARLHVQQERIGFFRQGTHELCDAGDSGQLHEGALEAVGSISRALAEGRVVTAGALEISEDVPATGRAVLLELDPGRAEHGRWDGVLTADSTTGVGIVRRGRLLASRGALSVADELTLPGVSHHLRLSRQVGAFFQGNRYLLQDLLNRMLEVIPTGPLTDLYAGSGVFGLAHAAAGRGAADLVESDRLCLGDLRDNAAPYADAVTVHGEDVEQFLARSADLDGTVLVDPPRTGLSREAGQALAGSRTPRIVYLSCDVATLARDTRRFADAGFALESVELFDLFPTTAHIETLVVLRR